MLMGPHFKQQHAGLHPTIFRPEQGLGLKLAFAREVITVNISAVLESVNQIINSMPKALLKC